MREFYLYGFKSREEYDKKSVRLYDDERRRIESWLGEYMKFVRTPDGKNMFLSIDSRAEKHNPLYKSWKAKSFTNGDITLHFILFDILYSPNIKRIVPELMNIIDNDYLSTLESIYTTSVNEFTIDEAPMAYKSIDDIIDVIRDSVDILDIMKPVYNFKATEG